MWEKISRKQTLYGLGAAGAGVILILYYYISGIGTPHLTDLMARIEPDAKEVACEVLSSRRGMCHFSMDDIQKYKLAHRLELRRYFAQGKLEEKEGCLADDYFGEPYKDKMRRSRMGVETYWFPAKTKAWKAWRASFSPKNAPDIYVMYYFGGKACIELLFPLF